MKKQFFILMLIFLVLPLLAAKVDFRPWQEGQYVTYHAQYKKTWETFKFMVYRVLEDGKAIIIAEVNSPDQAFAIAFRATQYPDLKKNSLSLTPLKVFSIRGSKLDKEHFMHYVSKFMNLFNVRAMYNLKIRKKPLRKETLRKSVFTEIQKVHLFTDPWPEFKYIIYYKLHPSIPLLGIFGSKLSDGRMILTMTSYGRSTRNLGTYSYIPTYIDFSFQVERKHPGFRITYPASWDLRPQKFGNRVLYMCSLGGNVHAASFSVELFTGTSAAMRKKFKHYTKTRGAVNLRYFKLNGQKMVDSYNISGTGLQSGRVFVYDYKKGGQVGSAVHAIYLSKDSKRFANLAFFMNFSEDNPHFRNCPKLVIKIKKIVASFRFTGE